MSRVGPRRPSSRTSLCALRATPILAALMLAGCAASGNRAPPTPAEIPALEARLQRDSTHALTMVRLGAAYREAGRTADARRILQRAVEAHPSDALAALYLGLTLEDLSLYTEARRLYTSYLDLGASRSVRDDIRQRLLLLERKELEETIRATVRREAQLADRAPEPRTVAVFPFVFTGRDSQYRALGRALSEMLVTDLSQTDRLRVLERLQVQLLLQEIRLAERGAVEPATAVRGGRLLGAAQVVQGSYADGGRGLRLQAAVVRVADAAAQQRTPRPPARRTPEQQRRDAIVPLAEEDAIARVLDIEKRLALRIYSTLGIELTAAERERVNRRPTENLQAILAYGLGLEAWDAARFDAAARHFEEAARLDPGFAQARDRAAAAAGLAAAASTTTSQLAQGAASDLPTVAATPARVSAEGLVPRSIGSRDAIAEALGSEGFGRRSVLEIIFRRP